MNPETYSSNEHLRPSSIAWGAIIVGISLYEAFCPDGEMLSERLDPIVSTRLGKLAVTAAGLITVAHLINELPEAIDPYHALGKLRNNNV